MSNPSMPKMPWVPRDFRSATQHWPPEARAVYRELLDLQWDVGHVPNDPKTVRKTCKIPLKWWRVWEPFWEEKFPLFNGVRKNPKLEQHRVNALAVYEKRRAAGRLGGKARKQTDKANGQASKTKSKSNTSFPPTPLSRSDPDEPLRQWCKERGFEL